jgi:hypothetical protein
MIPVGIPEKMQALVNGPRADSLRQLVGSMPEYVKDVRVDPLASVLAQQGAMGVMSIAADRLPVMYLNASDRSMRKPENANEVLAHEMGHYAHLSGYAPAFARTMNALPPLADVNFRRVSKSPEPFLGPKNTKNYQNPRPLMDGYVLGSEKERAAQAFGNAFEYLQRTASDTTDWRGRIGAYEASAPGTGELTRMMIRQPVYQNHPLRAQIRP